MDIDPRPAVATHPLAGSAPSSPSAARLPAGLQSPPIHRSGEVSSTQDEAARRLDAGEQAPFAVTARRQQAGRGRLGRRFVSPDGGNVYLTYAHSTRLAPSQRTWMPLVAGLAAVSAVDEVAGASGVRIGLKWPNDLQTADGRKLGGILVEGRGAHGVLIGIGINLHGPVRDGDGTVVPGAAWLLGEAGIRDGAESAPGDSVPAAAAPVAASPPGGTQRPEQNEELGDRIATAIVLSLGAELAALESMGGDAVTAGSAHRYTMTCLTIGQLVRVDPLGGGGAHGAPLPALVGTAVAIDDRGRLMVDPVDPLAEGPVAVDVGDVKHVRPGGPARLTRDADRGVEQEDHST
ncbi:MAG: biotin--[acetyl-CoA-carboxylase] ligase [Brachybacterium tyrofermentans]|uniref:Biotin--[acetyl-CoA-carboxylase] ligase n=1 Tax=Brachybacterium tyrofermentans TaxID=47848 RepID=A0ABW0FAA9_9MICO|nr:biotin--[acetyl-CoA-carboxylase] ligase [Brachybacterium tyrofermentans]SLM98597.1 Biotin operon repressor / Biotin-protein ligase [Corynebacterium xerosis]